MKPPLEAENLDDLLICRLRGELTSSLLEQLKKNLAERIRKTKILKVLLVLKEVEYITSRDLGALVQIYRFMDKERREHKVEDEPVLALSDLNPFVEDVIEMTKLETVFKIFETESEAVSALCARAAEAKPPSDESL
jgi:anti-anti-sigma factor